MLDITLLRDSLRILCINPLDHNKIFLTLQDPRLLLLKQAQPHHTPKAVHHSHTLLLKATHLKATLPKATLPKACLPKATLLKATLPKATRHLIPSQDTVKVTQELQATILKPTHPSRTQGRATHPTTLPKATRPPATRPRPPVTPEATCSTRAPAKDTSPATRPQATRPLPILSSRQESNKFIFY